MRKQKSSNKKGNKLRITLLVISFVLIFAVAGGTYFYVSNIRYEQNLCENFVEKVYSNEMGSYDFELAYSLNDQTAAFINCYGTSLHSPVFFSGDNSFYATHNAEKKPSNYGALYFDMNNVLFGKTKSKNLVIYGQNSIDDKQFGMLDSFEDIEFLKKNPVISVTTDNERKTYTVFAVYRTNANADDNDGYSFNYRPSTFSTDGAFLEWIENVEARSIYKTGLEVTKKDDVLTLVTFGDNYPSERLVVCAVSSENAKKDKLKIGAKAKYNEKVVYPNAWYTANNQEVPSYAEKQVQKEKESIALTQKLLEKQAKK